MARDVSVLALRCRKSKRAFEALQGPLLAKESRGAPFFPRWSEAVNALTGPTASDLHWGIRNVCGPLSVCDMVLEKQASLIELRKCQKCGMKLDH